MFQATDLKFDDLLGGLKFATNAKFQQNIPKIMPARPKKRDKGCEYDCNNVMQKILSNLFFLEDLLYDNEFFFVSSSYYCWT